MAVLTRNKSNIYGLISDLNTLQNNINAETTRAQTAEGDLSTLSTTAKTSLVVSINEVKTNLTSQASTLSTLSTDLGNEVTRATTAESTLSTNLGNEVTRATTAEGLIATNLSTETSDRILADNALDGRLDIIESGLVGGVLWKASFNTLADLETALTSAESTSVAGWSYYVKATNDGYVIVDENDGDYVPATWSSKSLIKFADYTETSGLVNTEKTRATTAEGTISTNLGNEVTRATTAEGTISTNLSNEVTRATTAEGTISTNLSNEVTRATTAEGTKLSKASNLSDVVSVSSARTNLDVYSKGETDGLLTSGGGVFITETLSVLADKITLAYAPKNGVVFNFGTVRHVDSNFVSYDIPVVVTGTPGAKEYLLSADASGQFDGKSVMIQYAYVPII